MHFMIGWISIQRRFLINDPKLLQNLPLKFSQKRKEKENMPIGAMRKILQTKVFDRDKLPLSNST